VDEGITQRHSRMAFCGSLRVRRAGRISGAPRGRHTADVAPISRRVALTRPGFGVITPRVIGGAARALAVLREQSRASPPRADGADGGNGRRVGDLRSRGYAGAHRTALRLWLRFDAAQEPPLSRMTPIRPTRLFVLLAPIAAVAFWAIAGLGSRDARPTSSGRVRPRIRRSRSRFPTSSQFPGRRARPVSPTRPPKIPIRPGRSSRSSSATSITPASTRSIVSTATPVPIARRPPVFPPSHCAWAVTRSFRRATTSSRAFAP
jgi:hypothetical protein